MPTLIAGIVVVALLYFAANAIRSLNPALIARLIKTGGGIVALAFAAFVGVRGEIALALPIALFGAGLLGWSPFGASLGSAWGRWSGAQSDGQHSTIRTQFVEMTLDRRTGALQGRLTSGAEAGRDLDSFALPELLSLSRGFDSDSRALLESYLDRRFPGWREDPQNASAGWSGRQNRRTAASSKMTTEEAYEILGLQAGAGRDDISRAHRGLMKKLHPDQGGSTYLAARVNEAKDTLLHLHRN